MRGVGERFGVQVVPLGPPCRRHGRVPEHRSARILWMRKRGAEAATTQMARMGAEDPSTISQRPT